MRATKAPRSLRFDVAVNSGGEKFDGHSGKKVSAVASLIAVASFSGAAEAQQSALPPVNVDAPVARPRPAASRPSADQLRARTALRRAARRSQPAQVAAVPFPNAGGLAADRNPYADAAAPYKVDRLQASGLHHIELARHQHHEDGAEEREQRDPAEDAHQRTVTFCLTVELVFQCVSLTSTRMV